MMTLKRMMMMTLLLMVTVSAMAAEQNIWLRITGNGKAQVSLDGKTLTFDKDNKATVKDAEGLKVAVKPDNGYTVKSVTAQLTIDAGKAETRGADDASFLKVEQNADGDYIFTMPEGFNVIISVTFESSKKGGDDPEPPVDPGYSGTYYIANKIWNGDHDQASEVGYEDYLYSPSKSDKNWYLVPARNPHQANKEDAFYSSDSYATSGDPAKPFLTTYRTNRDNNSIWVITKTGDKYLIKHLLTGKYLKYEPPVSGKPNRRSVHLEAVEGNTPPTGNEFLFTITTKTENSISGYNIKPTQADGNDAGGYLNPAGDNWPYYYAHKKHTDNIWCSGIVGYYGQQGGGSLWIFENVNDFKYKPDFSYNTDNQIVITYPESYDAIYYTTDGSEPPTSGDEHKYTAPFNLPANATSIKAVAVKDGVASPVAIYALPYFLGSTHKYIIQSKSCKFYNMIPNLSVDANMKNVSTLNVPSTTMAWHFENAADEDGQYYYIVSETENSEKWYMYYTSNTNKHIYLKNSKDASDNYKFNIDANPSGGYNLIPKGQAKAIYKNIFGDKNAGLKPVMFDGTITDAVARWDIISYSTTNLPMWEDQPFIVSTDNATNYYNIVSVSQPSKPLILNNSGDVKSETIPASDYDERKAMWVIKKVDSDADGLLDFYTFQNAYTGELLYYNGARRETKDDTGPGVLQMGKPTSEEALDSWSYFAVVQTVNGYNIIPSVLVDKTKAISTGANHEGFNCINRANGSDVTGAWYDNDDGSRWTFTKVDDDVKCMEPVFTEETDGSITITSVTNAAVIRYTVDDANDPNSESDVYTTKSNTSAQRVIKAIAIIGNDANTASDVVTLLNKPNITLTESGSPVTDETYTYDGNTKEPTVFEVSIGEAPNKTTATADTDYETVVSTDYTNNTNASTDAVKAKVTLRDKSSSIFIWHAEKEFKINPKEVGLTWTPDDSGQTTFTYTGVAQAPTVTASGLIGTDECTVTVTVTADEGSSLKDGEAVNIGSYTATASPLENTNYKLPDAKTRPFTITRAPVTVTADDKTWGFGDDEPELTATITGLVNNESEDLIIYTISRADIENSDGTYTITPAGLTEQGNYSVTYVTGVFTISKKAIGDGTVPAEGITIDITYNGNDYQVTVKHGGNEIGQGTDYTWDGDYNDPAHPEYYVVTVTGKGNNYTGEAKATYIQLNFDDTTPNDDTKTETAAAYYATQNLQLSGGIEAWYVTSLVNNELTFEKVKVVEGENEISYLPANQPVILFGNSSSTGFMLKPYTGTTMDFPASDEQGANILKVVTEDPSKAVNLGEVYVFSKGEFVLTMEGDLKKGKVYLDNPAYNSSFFSRGALSATRGGTTCINDVRLSKTNDQFNEGWYALDGQKLNKKPTRKGIYLQNGKKVVIN
jgi:hypothetical protein